MKKIPLEKTPYKKTPTFDEESVPSGLLKDHSTRSGVWGKIVTLEGNLLYVIPADNKKIKLTTEVYGVVEPEVKHYIQLVGKVRFYVEFYK